MLGFPLNWTFKFFKTLIALGVFILAFTLISPTVAQAGMCIPPFPCMATVDCVNAGCSDCVQCINDMCQLDDTYCQDRTGGDTENICRVGLCLTPDAFLNQSGCTFDDPAVAGDTSFEEICYYCDPPVLAVDTCGNGVCDSPGENCSNCSLDCLTPGDTETCQDTTGQSCQQPSDCADGEVCTVDECVGAAALQCANTPAQCSGDTVDLCCPSGCVGIPAGESSCRAAGDPPGCDADCWPVQLCGDIFVQSNNGNPPETCDDGIPGPSAGLFPDGTTISEDACRDPGNTDECTFCGDDIIQTASGEQCDGTSLGECESCSVACLCALADVIVQGSGPPGGPCSLNPHATDDPIKGSLGLISLALAMGLLVGWRKRLN